MREVIGNELYERAWESTVATSGQALLHAGREYAKQYGLEALENQREIPRRCDRSGPMRRGNARIVACHRQLATGTGGSDRSARPAPTFSSSGAQLAATAGRDVAS